MGTKAKRTQDHEEIQRWVEQRGGEPAVVKETENNDAGAGVLRIKFDPAEDDLEPISWEEFFETFDERGLIFLYQEESNGNGSRFFKVVQH